MNYFIMNTRMDYEQGMGDNVEYDDTGVWIRDPDALRPGTWLSRRLDAGEEELIWHRLTVDRVLEENTAVQVCLYTADSVADADRIEAWKREPGLEAEGVLARMEPYRRVRASNPEELLLHQVRGRFLWIAVLMWGNHGNSPKLGSVRVCFPRETWTSLLPEIYQRGVDSFLERYLAVFQSVYEEVTMDIQDSSRYLDLGAADRELLVWLAEWLDMDNLNLWDDRRLKRYLERGALEYRRRGTRKGLERLIGTFTGRRPFVEEELKGKEPFRFTIYLDEKAVPTPEQYRAVMRIIREGVPAWMEVRLIVLIPYLFLNQDSYVGINSVLGQYGAAVLDGVSRLPLSVLGGEKA